MQLVLRLCELALGCALVCLTYLNKPNSLSDIPQDYHWVRVRVVQRSLELAEKDMQLCRTLIHNNQVSNSILNNPRL